MRPSCLLSRPGPEPDAATRAEFDALLAAALAAGPGTAIDYRLAAPKWQFLCHVADRGEAVLHGSSDPDIARFEPRQSNDIAEFGNRTAVYAAADGLWAMYFAILDRPRHRMSLTNSCFRVVAEDGIGGPSRTTSSRSTTSCSSRASSARARSTCCRPDRFEREADHRRGGLTVRTAQAACLQPVEPMAKLAIEPRRLPAADPRPRPGDPAGPDRGRPGGFPWLAADETLT